MRSTPPRHRTDCLECYRCLRVAEFTQLIAFALSDSSKTTGTITYTWQPMQGSALPDSITLSFTIDKANKRITLSYTADNEPCTFSLVAVPIHFKTGLQWHLSSGTSGSLCKKLYYYRNKFVSRTEMHGVYYRQQYLSAPQRKARKLEIAEREARRQLVSTYLPKHFKKSYNNKPTKRYLTLIEKHILLPPKGK